jgi:hypothetical protein
VRSEEPLRRPHLRCRPKGTSATASTHFPSGIITYPLSSREIALAQAEIGIIGGSGLYSMKGLTDIHEVQLETPFGPPSDPYVLGTLAGRKVAFLALH